MATVMQDRFGNNRILVGLGIVNLCWLTLSVLWHTIGCVSRPLKTPVLRGLLDLHGDTSAITSATNINIAKAIFIVLLSTAEPYARFHSGYLTVIGQAAILTFESACRLRAVWCT